MLSLTILELLCFHSDFIFTFKKIPLYEKCLPDICQNSFSIRIHSQKNNSIREIKNSQSLVESMASGAVRRKPLLRVYLILVCSSSCFSAVSASGPKHIVSRVWMNWIYLLEEKFCQLSFIVQLGQSVLAFKEELKYLQILQTTSNTKQQLLSLSTKPRSNWQLNHQVPVIQLEN